MPIPPQHELYQKKIEKSEDYLAVSGILLRILQEGLLKYGDGEPYRFGLNMIMRIMAKSNIELTKYHVGKIIYASFKKIDLDYINKGSGHTTYETTLDGKKIKKLEEWTDGIYFKLILPGSF